MDHQRSSYRARHRQADRVGPGSEPDQAPWRAADGGSPRRGGFHLRGTLVLGLLALVAVGAWIPFALGRAGADTLQTASNSPASTGSRSTNPVDAASTSANAGNTGEASRSARRKTVSSSAALPAASPSTSAPANSAASPTATGIPLGAATPGSVAEIARAVELANDARADAGCDPLHSDSRLDAAALAHSEDMIARDYFSHTTPDGVSPWDRAKAAGYTVPTGENIALGQPDADAVMAAWMESEGHRANILNCASNAIGMGLALDSSGTPYWTQMFGAE